MHESSQLLDFLQKGIANLLEQQSFDGGQDFRRTQKQALEAYQRYLSNENYSTEQKLKGFFEIPTGVGKTAVFVGIIAAVHKVAKEAGEELKTVIVVPTVQLLEQTEEAFQGNDRDQDEDEEDYFSGFAPWLKGQIGLYGDGNKNLKAPLTIMTYNAWLDLTETGKIHSNNIDILISDEAHRGTSQRRIASIKDAFNENTVQLAFTATAHFDESKSVQNSHDREIFYKSPADAIREDELASYVSSQRFIIRVNPDDYMLSDEFQEASEERKTAYRRAAKQNAWNKRMVTIFREGRDEKTGDCLSDNQAGFFVEGIRQSEKLEKLLNTDAELERRAEEQGYKAVAVAIHSKLSKTEQRRRYADYKNGKYLAVIGDEMFKEGFDHPPMKTIFDCPHASVVDKAQILGRGLRKWWNSLKGRLEGLTIIDTVVYFADEDKKQEERNRVRALIDTVSVKQVLEDSHLDGPSAPVRLSSGGGGTGGDPIFNDDPDVEEFTTVEGIYELESSVERFRKEHLTPLTDEMRDNLAALFDQAGISPTVLVEKVKDWPYPIYSLLIFRWLDGTNEEVDPVSYEAVCDRLDDIVEGRLKLSYDLVKANASKRRWDDDRVPLTEEMRAKLVSLAEDTGMAGSALFKYAGEDKPKSVTRSLIASWMRGPEKGKPAVSSVKSNEWEYVIKLYEKVLKDFRARGLDPRKVEITPEMKAQFSQYNDIVGSPALARHPDTPEDLKKSTIYCWITGDATTARKYHLDFALKVWPQMVKDKLAQDFAPKTKGP